MQRTTLAALLAVAAAGPAARAQQPEPVAIQFSSAGSIVRGRFFPTAATEPLATVLLLPGWGFNPTDVIGLGQLLSARDVNVLTFTPRGARESEGTLTYGNALDDVAAALRWFKGPEARRRFRVDPMRLALGGHSFGGGVAMVYAARDTTVRRVISLAGADHGEYARMVRRDPTYAAALRERLGAARAPEGPVRFNLDSLFADILANERLYGHPENAPRLADRSILLLGGWDDTDTRIETMVLPMYRALKRQPRSDVTIIVYQDDHSFGSSRERVATDIREWLAGHPPQ